MINIILSIVLHKNKLAIGRNNGLLFRFKNDMEFFKETTLGNIVVMGYKTYHSLPHKPLSGRLNFVLTRKTELYNIPENNDFYRETTYFMNYDLFTEIYDKWTEKPIVFVIGGSEIYNLFIYKAKNIYITDIRKSDGKEVRFEVGNEPDTFFELPSKFKLKTVSEIHLSENGLYSYRFLKYQEFGRSQEYRYFDLMKDILREGNNRDDRTTVGTVSIFGTQMRFNISDTIPLMTAKQVPFRIILEELLWFCRGDTDSKILKAKGVHIWNGNTSREFLDRQGLFEYEEGVLGAGYGFQWRHFGAEYKQEFADSSKIENSEIGGFDQLSYIEHLLKTDPFSRRIVLSAWNPTAFHKTALPPCHILLQFYVEEIEGEKYLSSHFYMRSNDVFLASVFNVVSYTILTYILALKCDMKPKEIVYSCGDTHIYKSHLTQVQELLTRKPRPFPKLILNQSLKSKDWSEMTEEDFELVGYYPYGAIKAEMAI